MSKSAFVWLACAVVVLTVAVVWKLWSTSDFVAAKDPVSAARTRTSNPAVGANKPGSAPTTGAGHQKSTAAARANPKRDDQHGSRSAYREPLFEKWPKPKLTLVFTGEQAGYIEPCGCAGLENQKGGLRRRHTFLKQLESNGWPTLAFDSGGLIHRFGPQAVIKYRSTVEALKIMHYAAIGFGPADLKLPTGEVLSVVADASGTGEGQNNPFVSANVGLFGLDSGFTLRFRVVEAGGMKVGVTTVLGDELQKQINNSDVQFLSADEGLKEVWPQLDEAHCDYLVLLAHAEPAAAQALAEKFPQFHFVVSATGSDEPPFAPRKLNDGETLLIEVGHKGMYAVVLGLYDDKKTPVRYQRAPLDSRFQDSPEMDKLMQDYQAQLKDRGWEGLGLRRVAHSRGEFVGAHRCAECHEKAFDIWNESPHAHATATLAKVKPPRQFDPECISCHATGWSPQGFFPYESGFDSLQDTPALAGNGCENCHGPGAAHVAAENGDDAQLQQQLRDALHLSVDEANDEHRQRSCAQCHDLDNSPGFKFDEYWSKIAH